MDNSVWSIVSAIGTCIGAVATFSAVIVALWQTKYSTRKRIEVKFTDNMMLFNQTTGDTKEFVGLEVSNIGNRKVKITSWGLRIKKKYVFITNPPNADSFERIAYPKFPLELDMEDSVSLPCEKRKFMEFMKEHKDEINGNKRLRFFVQDSTGKMHYKKTKKKAKIYFE